MAPSPFEGTAQRLRWLGPRARWLLPALLLIGACLPFLPVLSSRVFHLDDSNSIVYNPIIRARTWAELRPAFNMYAAGFSPLSTLAWWLAFRAHGLDPRVFHALNLVLHCINALLLYMLIHALLCAVRPAVARRHTLAGRICAALAALLYAVHPQRVEVVAWAGLLMYPLASAAALLTSVFYLRSCAALPGRRGRLGWLSLSLIAYAVSLSSFAIAVTLPAVLLMLDVYPLRRLRPGKGLGDPSNLRALAEKAPFFLLSMIFVALTFMGRAQVGRMVGWSGFGFVPRLAHSLFSTMFYLERTVVPYGLCPWTGDTIHYALHSNPLDMLCAPRTLSFLAVSAAAVALRRRFPAFLTAWLCWLTLLAPVSGFSKHDDPNPLAFDKWHYLASMVWPMLAGPALLRCWRAGRAGLVPDRVFRLLPPALAGALALYGALAFLQARRWSDNVRLFQHCVETNPRSLSCYPLLAEQLIEADRYAEAEAVARESLKLENNVNALVDAATAYRWDGRLEEARRYRGKSHDMNAVAAGRKFVEKAHWLSIQGKPDRARAMLEDAIEVDPNNALANLTLGLLYSQQGLYDKAVPPARAAVRIDPNNATARNNLGFYLQSLGRLDEAAAEYREAVRLAPDFALASNNLRAAEAALAAGWKPPPEWKREFDLGLAYAGKGLMQEAVEHARAAARGNPSDAGCHNNLGYFLQRSGLLQEAAAEYREALRLRPDMELARNNLRGVEAAMAAPAAATPQPGWKEELDLGLAAAGRGALDEAVAHTRVAVQRNPGYSIAHNNLGYYLQSQGRLDEAIAAYEAALRLNPDFDLAKNNLRAAKALRAGGKR